MIPETGAAALLFAAAFLAGDRLRKVQSRVSHRAIVSFGGGMAAAYVFLHLMPKLHGARQAFATAAPAPLPYDGMATYYLALLGFLVFYGLDHWHAHLRERSDAGNAEHAFRLYVGGFSAYVWLMAYLLVRNLEETEVSTALYAAAITCHFLALDHELRSPHGAAYQHIGRFILAGTAVAGWGSALLFALPKSALALLTAFISGAIIMNGLIMELPSEKDGRFWPFMMGGTLYGLILLPLR